MKVSFKVVQFTSYNALNDHNVEYFKEFFLEPIQAVGGLPTHQILIYFD